MSALSKYWDDLARLPDAVGERNHRLLGIANRGIEGGRSPEEVVREIIEASGDPPLAETEVRRAVTKAERDVQPNGGNHPHTRPTAPAYPTRARPSWEAGALQLVSAMCKAGSDIAPESFLERSPVRVTSDPVEQTQTFLERLWGPSEYLFIGEQYSPAERGVALRTRDEWLTAPHAELGPQIMANPLTGLVGKTQDGKASRRSLECVAAYRYALIEFDAMPVEVQFAFWAGIVDQNVLPVASIVFSGGKSLHGLVRLNAWNAKEWKSYWGDLERLLCSGRAPAEFRADAACKDATRQTRLPGVVRPDIYEAQVLLWLA